CDFVVRAAGMTYILKLQQEGYELYEFLGYPDTFADVSVRVADVDDDTYVDLVVARGALAPHKSYLNQVRLELTIHDGDDAYQAVDGGSYAEFVIELDAPPV